jgi:hypothetical protein
MKSAWAPVAALAFTAVSCGRTQADRGLGESCSSSEECLAARECLETVAGRPRVCAERCAPGSTACASRAYPDAFCYAAPDTSEGVCVVPCATDEVCPGDLVCGAVGHCVPHGDGWADAAGPFTPRTSTVDLLVIVDNSGSMAEEQRLLTDAFDDFLRELVAPGDADGDTSPDRAPVEDLNLGVVDTDLGTGGYPMSTCSNSDVGDDGCFRNVPSSFVSGCTATYPAFLSRSEVNAAGYPPEQLALDFRCVATLGTSGCGFEQQLEAMRRALVENQSPGRCNSGFLRPNSILVVVWITDEEDCSVDPVHNEMFDQDRTDLGHLGIRCFLHPDMIYGVDRYIGALGALRGAHPDRLVLGMIVGVPPDAPSCVGPDASLELCLGEPEMTERIDPAMTTSVMPVCWSEHSIAKPSRRFVSLGMAFEATTVVGSICAPDYGPTLDRLLERIGAALPEICLDVELPFDPVSCSTPCRVTEVLSDAGPCPTDPECSCSGSSCISSTTGEPCEPLYRDGGTRTEDGTSRRVCLLRQAERSASGAECLEPARSGWTYDPPGTGGVSCAQLELRSGGVELLPDGARAWLECPEVP